MVSASKHGVVQNSSISAILPTSLFEALTELLKAKVLFGELFHVKFN